SFGSGDGRSDISIADDDILSDMEEDDDLPLPPFEGSGFDRPDSILPPFIPPPPP
ncbi:hypothetical protein SK128_018358, partial [Halocaridina rubra]